MKFYDFVSYVLSPHVFLLYVTAIFTFYSPIGLGSLDITSAFATGILFLFFIPTVSVFYFSSNDINVKNRKKRNGLYLTYLFSFLIATMIFWNNNSYALFFISITYFLITLLLSLINLSWKISAHAAGSTGPITALICVYGPQLMPLYLLSLLVMYTRVKMRVHTTSQVIAGSLIGIITTYSAYLALW